MSKAVAPLLLGTLLGGLFACGKPKPCTTCPNVAGRYDEIFPEAPPSTSTCKKIGIRDSSGEVVVEQDGNVLTYVTASENTYKGVLLDDNTAEFEPRHLDSVSGEPAHFDITIDFLKKGSKWSYKLTSTLQWDNGQCSVTGHGSGEPIE